MFGNINGACKGKKNKTVIVLPTTSKNIGHCAYIRKQTTPNLT